jgi:quercetin dioxygenase-like cupin family protein
MIEPVVIPPAGGEVVGDAPDRRVEILCDHDALHVTWSRFGAGRDGADLHVHHHHSDLFYVLDGELTLRLGAQGTGVVLPAGTLARVPPDVVHGFRNASGAEVRYLNLHAPGREFANFMRAGRDGRTPPAGYDQHPPPADGGRPASEAVIGAADVRVDEPGRRSVLLADTAEIAIAEELRGPDGAVQPSGPHDVASWLYVLDGELAFTSEERTLRAPAGAWLQVPAGLRYALSCAGAEPVRYLDLRAPGSGLSEPPP